MSKAFAIFLLVLSLFMLSLAVTSMQQDFRPLTFLIWAAVGGFSLYKLCAKPSRSS